MSNIKCWDVPWPENELEMVSLCPVCGDTTRELLFERLVDNAFFVANGTWNLYQCTQCSSAYLNPRPNQSSIHKAYGSYYTHESMANNRKSVEKLSKFRKIRRMLANGYCNYHHGTRRTPSNGLGAWLLYLYPRFRKTLKAQFRYLPKPKAGQALLDIGCGNGDFLSLAAEVGWDVSGVDPDPKAVNVARLNGHDVVLGGIEKFANNSEVFDVITMNHVIEHVHDPIYLVESVFRLLKPGGILFIDTPNIESSGAKMFGKNWRGLETPRHLVLFSREGLSKILNSIGFSSISFLSRREVRKNIALKSYRMQLGKSPDNDTPKRLPPSLLFRSVLPRSSNREEFLTVIAEKSKK